MAEKKNIFSFKYFVIIFIIIITAIIAFQIFGASRFETTAAEQGEVIDGFWTDALVVRDEAVLSSPFSGRAELLDVEGDRQRAGSKIAEIITSNNIKSIYSNKAGIISFAVDGLESKINIDNINNINLNNFDEIKGDYQHRISGRDIDKSEPLYRVVNNFELYLIAASEKKEAERFSLNEIVFIQEKNSSELLKAVITNIINLQNGSYIFIKMDLFVPQWLNVRRVNVNFIKNIYRGIKIPKKAVFNQPSGQGVLKVTGYNKYEFQEILVLEGNKDEVIVSGLEVGDEVITNPEDFNYGREV